MCVLCNRKMKLRYKYLHLLSMIIFCSVAIAMQHSANATAIVEYSNANIDPHKNPVCQHPYSYIKGVQNLVVNDTVSLICTAYIDVSSSTPKHMWYKDGQRRESLIDSITVRKLNLSANYQLKEVTANYTIENAMAYDSGRYICMYSVDRELSFVKVYVHDNTVDHLFHPPILSPGEKYIDLEMNSTLQISCTGKYPIMWSIKNSTIGAEHRRVSIKSSVNSSQPIYKYKSILTLQNLDLNDIGFYSCYYKGSQQFMPPDTATSLYVFVKGVKALFLNNSDITFDLLKLFEDKQQKGVIPCLPSSSTINVTLWKKGSERDEHVALGKEVIFDPIRGFILYFPSLYFIGNFQCRAQNGDTYEEINVTLSYLSKNCPKSMLLITLKSKQPIYVNGLMHITCEIKTTLDYMMDITWKYPPKVDRRRIQPTAPSKFSLRVPGVKVRNVTLEYSGTYGCSMLDRSLIRTSDEVQIFIHGEPTVSRESAESAYNCDHEYVLRCDIVGYPHPVIWWSWKPSERIVDCSSDGDWRQVKFDGKSQNREEVSVEFTGNVKLETRLSVTAGRSRCYMCYAYNNMGSNSVVFPFLETGAEDEVEFFASNTNPVDGDFVQLECKVPCKFTHIEWNWKPTSSVSDVEYSNNVSGFNKRKKRNGTASEFITFDPIHQNMSGVYECIASNIYENLTVTKSLSMGVRAIKGPVIIRTNLDGKTITNSTGVRRELLCYVEGVPFPAITWTKDDEILVTDNTSVIEFAERNQKLIFKTFLQKHAGYYQCIIENRGGQIASNATFIDYVRYENVPVLAGLLTFGFLIFVFCVHVICCYFIRKKKRKELEFANRVEFECGNIEILNPDLPLEEQADLLPYDNKWEFNKKRLILGKTLGQGEFGRVVKAKALGLVKGEASTIVAVKMLKRGASKEQRKALTAELKILIHIGKHLNIVNLMGAITKHLCNGQLYIIIEYCCYGSLRNFLRRQKESFIDELDPETGQLNTGISPLPGCSRDSLTQKVHTLNDENMQHDEVADNADPEILFTTNPSGTRASNNSFNKNSSIIPPTEKKSGNENHGETQKKIISITTRDLLSFTFQCAKGMNYLSSKKLIHRDLAARNVLLAEGKIIKICDFGLAKDCYKYSKYVKKTHGMLPIKWMAIESIKDRVFTSKSDVWSFGVLLWEIFTLGNNPYSGLQVKEFIEELKNGYRMEKPQFAPEAVYQLMRKCWLEDPVQRPGFKELVEDTGKLLEAHVREDYIDLNKPYEMFNEGLLDDRSYLNMNGQNNEYRNEIYKSHISPNNEKRNTVIASENITADTPYPSVSMELAALNSLEGMSETVRKKEFHKKVEQTPAVNHEESNSLSEITSLSMKGLAE